MSTEGNKAVARRFLEEILNRGNLAAIPEVIAPNWVNDDQSLPPMRGHAGAQQLVMVFRTGLPDFHLAIEDLVAEDDKVGFHCVATGTHTGELLGVPATGKVVRVTVTGILHLADGKLVENRVNFDALGLMQQIGVVPMPSRA
jgi:steroid delta-isomerase-like uncharacterized protein